MDTKRRILVIDDDLATRAQIVRLLQLKGYDTMAAENGLVGVEMAQRELPDIIVCDIMMPELDGYGVLLRLRDIPQTRLIPFIFLTAKSQIDDLRKGMELGADDYLTKPLIPENLFNSIERRLEKRDFYIEETKRQREEVSMMIAASMPSEVEGIIERLVSIGNMVALKYSEQDEQIIEMRDSLQKETSSLKRCIRRIDLFGKLPTLYAKRFEAGVADYVPPQTDISVINEIVDTTQTRCNRSSRIEINSESATIGIDRNFLEVLIDELLTNAFEATSCNSKPLLSLVEHSGIITLSVSDAGPGLSDKQIEEHSEFSKFGHLSSSSDRPGLGLPLVHGITRLHGGEVEIIKNEAGGTSVSVFLPSNVTV